jgi:hypothetical protein
MEYYSGSLYLAGSFASVGGVAVTNGAIWTNGLWLALNADVSGLDFISSLKHFGSRLCLAGSFGWLNGVSAGNLIQWDGTNWLALGAGTGNSLDGTVYALATDGANVYATGSFGAAGTNAASGLAQWDGTNWTATGRLSLTNGWFGKTLAVAGSNIYVGGSFTITEAGVTNLAAWNGVTWSSPGGLLSNVFVSEILTISNLLCVSGSLTDAAGHNFGPVAVWDGTHWNNVPWSIDSEEDRLATDKTNLYIAKSIFTNDDYIVQVGRWDGTNLTLVGGSFASMRADTLAACGTTLYLAGTLTASNYAPTLYQWKGTYWQSMGTPFAPSGYIATILPLRGNLYVAGNFASLNGTIANNIAKWNGCTWLNLGAGIGYGPGSANIPSIWGMISLGRRIFVGGQFTSANVIDSGNFAVWNEAPEIRLGNPRTQPVGEFTFDVSGVSGDQIEIQASSTLTDWTPVANISLETERQSFSDLASTNSNNRFYRARFVK